MKKYCVPTMRLHQLKMTEIIAATTDQAFTKQASSGDKNNIEDFQTETVDWYTILFHK